jgi:hypothetical protein
MSWQRDKNTVTISMTVEDWEELLLALGRAGGLLLRDGARTEFRRHLALVNRINSGNPNFFPYEIPTDPRLNRENL